MDTALFLQARQVQHTEMEEVSRAQAPTFFSQCMRILTVPKSNREPVPYSWSAEQSLEVNSPLRARKSSDRMKTALSSSPGPELNTRHHSGETSRRETIGLP